MTKKANARRKVRNDTLRPICIGLLCVTGPLLLAGFLLTLSAGSGCLPPKFHTVYTPNYSEEGFHNLKAGMAPDEVLRVLGKPFSIDNYPRHKQIWCYSRYKKLGSPFGSWNHRAVIFSNDLLYPTEGLMLYK